MQASKNNAPSHDIRFLKVIDRAWITSDSVEDPSVKKADREN